MVGYETCRLFDEKSAWTSLSNYALMHHGGHSARPFDDVLPRLFVVQRAWMRLFIQEVPTFTVLDQSDMATECIMYGAPTMLTLVETLCWLCALMTTGRLPDKRGRFVLVTVQTWEDTFLHADESPSERRRNL